MALAGVELETLVSETDALTTRSTLLGHIAKVAAQRINFEDLYPNTSAVKCIWPDIRTMNIP